MTLYSFVLFAHVTSVLPLGACLSLEVLSLFHLRRASTLNEIQLWIEPVPGLSGIALGSILVILFPGIYLTIQMSAFNFKPKLLDLLRQRFLRISLGIRIAVFLGNCPADDGSERWTAESDAGS
jgi:hypothetical protein